MTATSMCVWTDDGSALARPRCRPWSRAGVTAASLQRHGAERATRLAPGRIMKGPPSILDGPFISSEMPLRVRRRTPLDPAAADGQPCCRPLVRVLPRRPALVWSWSPASRHPAVQAERRVVVGHSPPLHVGHPPVGAPPSARPGAAARRWPAAPCSRAAASISSTASWALSVAATVQPPTERL